MINTTGEGLIFLISQPRSGSTVLQKILSNNDIINTASEPWVLLNFLTLYNPSLIQAKFNYEITTQAVLDFFMKHDDNFDEKIKQLIVDFYQPYVGGSYQYFLDKTPRYYEIVGSIQKWFPRAKIVILLRNPIDVLKSVARTWQLHDYENLYSFHRDFLYAPQMLSEFLRAHKQNPYVFPVKFEDLFDKNNECLNALFDWLDIPFDTHYLNYANNKKAEGLFGDRTFSKSSHTLTKKKEYQKDLDFSNSFWENFIKGYIHYLGEDFLKDYGDYPVTYPPEETETFTHFLDYCNFRNKDTFTYEEYRCYKVGRKLRTALSKIKINSI